MPGHDPYHPSERQQQRILARQPGRAVVLVGEPATVGSLRQHWAEATGGGDSDGSGGGEPDGFGGYVARRATLALDRAEYRLLGPRYKTPSLVKEEILSSRRFRSGLRQVRRDSDEVPSLAEADHILDELVAGWSRRLIDIMPTVGRLIFQRGFDPQIDYDASQVERLRAAMQRHPCIFLWSHRSNLDNLVLSAAMQEQGLPPAHVFAGINMAFGPMGAILRRAGVIFIRRSTGDDPCTSTCSRSTWDTSSRSGSTSAGRSRAPAHAPGRCFPHGWACCPTPPTPTCRDASTTSCCCRYRSPSTSCTRSLSTPTTRGVARRSRRGSAGSYGFIKAQGARHYGKIYVRFGEPVSLAPSSARHGGETATDPAARRLALQKTAFEVAWRINQGMPVTATAAITTILLAMQGAALTFGQIRLGLADALDYLESRAVPRTASLRALSAPGPVRATLDALRQGGLVTLCEDGREPVWLIEPDQQVRRHVLPELPGPLHARHGPVEPARLRPGRPAPTRLRPSGPKSPGCVTC